jgi:hypothetical protein
MSIFSYFIPAVILNQAGWRGWNDHCLDIIEAVCPKFLEHPEPGEAPGGVARTLDLT